MYRIRVDYRVKKIDYNYNSYNIKYVKKYFIKLHSKPDVECTFISLE